jgi:hypothetical protein
MISRTVDSIFKPEKCSVGGMIVKYSNGIRYSCFDHDLD